MRSFVSCVALCALVSVQAMAAEVPDMVGTWKISQRRHPAASESQQQSAELASLTITISRQTSDSFSGTVVGPKRKPEQIIGSFRRDGRTFVYSSAKTAGVGQVQGDEMQICRTDTGCAVLTRTK
jgi:hypothetical protein